MKIDREHAVCFTGHRYAPQNCMLSALRAIERLVRGGTTVFIAGGALGFDTIAARAVLSDIINCNIYPLDTPLAYNDDVRSNLMKQRMRFEGQSLFPEAMTNDIRLNGSGDSRRKYVYAPSDNVYRYYNDLWQTEDTYTCFIDYGGGNPSNMADEIKSAG